MCIQIFKLNEREQLVDGRKNIRRNSNAMIIEFQNAHTKLSDPTYIKKQAYQEIIEHYEELIGVFEGKKPYTIAYLSILQKQGFSIEWLQKQCQIFQDLLTKLDH
jgi:hypothetical protein